MARGCVVYVHSVAPALSRYSALVRPSRRRLPSMFPIRRHSTGTEPVTGTGMKTGAGTSPFRGFRVYFFLGFRFDLDFQGLGTGLCGGLGTDLVSCVSGTPSTFAASILQS